MKRRTFPTDFGSFKLQVRIIPCGSIDFVKLEKHGTISGYIDGVGLTCHQARNLAQWILDNTEQADAKT